MPIVHLRINDAATNSPTPVRLRITDANGGYCPPLGRLAEFAAGDHEDVGGNLLLDGKQYCHIDGACEVELPAGRITIEATKGFEFRPLLKEIDLKPGQLSIRLAIERWADARAEGWHSGDTRAQFLSPHAALLEAAAEDLAIVHLLASAWQTADGKVHSLPNLLAFSGQAPALALPGHAVTVNTLNTSPLGRLALLHCHRIVYPLHVERIDWTLADWCEQCHRKGGLVIWPDALSANDRAERRDSEALADLILGKIDALETTDLLWCSGDNSDYYDLLNCGLHVPLVGGSGKQANNMALGCVRTYAQLPVHEPWSSKGWIETVRAGKTFVSNGPLLTFTVNENGPGAMIDAVTAESRLRLQAQVRRLSNVERVQILRNGEVVREAVGTNAADCAAAIDAELPAMESGWWAARCWGRDPSTCAHTSPIYVRIEDQPMSRQSAARKKVQLRLLCLENHVDALTEARRFVSEKDERRVRAILDAARQKLQP